MPAVPVQPGTTLSTPPSGQCALAVGGAVITHPVVAVVPPFDDGVALEGDYTYYRHRRQARAVCQIEVVRAFYKDESVAYGDISDRYLDTDYIEHAEHCVDAGFACCEAAQRSPCAVPPDDVLGGVDPPRFFHRVLAVGPHGADVADGLFVLVHH